MIYWSILLKICGLALELEIAYFGVSRYQKVSIEYKTTFGKIIKGLTSLSVLHQCFPTIKTSVLTIKISSNKSVRVYTLINGEVFKAETVQSYSNGVQKDLVF